MTRPPKTGPGIMRVLRGKPSQEGDVMRKSRFRDEQIVGILKEQVAGGGTATLCRRHGISEQTLYRCKRKYGGLELSEAKRLRTLEKENARLKRLVAEQALRELLQQNF